MTDRVDGDPNGGQQGAPKSSRAARRAASHEHAARLKAAQRRAGAAKRLFGVAAALIFGAAAVFAKHSYPGHPKSPAVPLGAPQRFIDVVRQDQLQGGVVGPPQAPSDAVTGVS